MLKKVGLAVVMFAIAGVASADSRGGGIGCINLGFIEIFCQAPPKSGPASAPEIDPASAMAGLTMLAGGLAVLRGRRKKISNE
jgi:LPXTG-motif cell wall-anchored protein